MPISALILPQLVPGQIRILFRKIELRETFRRLVHSLAVIRHYFRSLSVQMTSFRWLFINFFESHFHNNTQAALFVCTFLHFARPKRNNRVRYWFRNAEIDSGRCFVGYYTDYFPVCLRAATTNHLLHFRTTGAPQPYWIMVTVTGQTQHCSSSSA